MNRCRNFGAGCTVDGSVMKFSDQSKAALRNPFDVIETLNDIGFPQRSTRIQWPRVQTGCLDTELAPVAGTGEGDVPHMEFEVEIRVLDPVGMIEAHRHSHKALPECTRFMQAFVEEIENLLESYRTAWRRRLIVNSEAADVHRHVAGFQI